METKSTAIFSIKKNVNRFNRWYRYLVGYLLYLAYVSRPAILLAVNCLSQFEKHFTDACLVCFKEKLQIFKRYC